MKKLTLLAAVVALVLIGPVNPSSAIAPPVADGCVDASPDGVDIDTLDVVSNGGTDLITVTMTLCAVPVDGAKYRVHFDYADDLASGGNLLCETTSDDTSMLTRRNSLFKSTGPGTISVVGSTITYVVPYAALDAILEEGLSSGDDLEIWADTHKRGIQDRAPDTLDPCSKPQAAGEVLEITLN
ncbi:hypothetical protein LCGC14_2192370 [marine sediment metagenome]|uniref:Uncharacterized protein n=1 Tax=marine sediment metagenome TaxID=412755 RepID=A0A0F9E676_9ZZZZ